MARILVVDDEPDVRELFNITLKMAGHQTDTAKHGLEAIERLATESPDLIVLDLMMPHLDGFTFLARVRDEMATKPMRVLVATAKVLEDADQAKLGDWPVVGVLNKGELDIGQMVTVVSTALSKDPLKGGAEAAAEPEKEKAVPSAGDTPAKPAEAAGEPVPKSVPSAPPAQSAAKPTSSSSPTPSAGTPSTSIAKPAADRPAEKAAAETDKTAPAADAKKDAEALKSEDQKKLSTKPLVEGKDTSKPQSEAEADAADKPTAPKSAP
ncbi:MAG: response regulator [Anaerolineae bacterium]|nr:response regulator [Anaerolineae bacterium]